MLANPDNTLICSVKWGIQDHYKNSFFPFEKQYQNKSLNIKIFVYEPDDPNAIEFRNKYNLMGEYIYFKIFKLYEDLKKEIEEKKWEHIIFLDYTDTIFIGNEIELFEKINSLEGVTTFGSEENQFPLQITMDNWPFKMNLIYPYLNSGMIYSKSNDFLNALIEAQKLVNEVNMFYFSDQGVWQVIFHEKIHKINLDRENILFYNLSNRSHDNHYKINDNRLICNKTNNKPCFIHQNGMDSASLYDLFKEK